MFPLFLIWFFFKNNFIYFFKLIFIIYISFLILELFFLYYLKNFHKISRIDYYLDQIDEGNNLELWSGYLKDKDNNLFFSNIPNSKILFCNETGKWVTYKSDKFGFNNVGDNGVYYDFVMLGDSFTEGMCVDRNFNLASNLTNLSKKKYLNLGMSGTGPIEQIIIYQEYAWNYKYDDIIWLFYEGNDIINFRDKIKLNDLKKYFDYNFKPNFFIKSKDYEKKKKNILNRYINKKDDFALAMNSRSSNYLLKSEDLESILKIENVLSTLSIFFKNIMFFNNKPYNSDYLLSHEILQNIETEYVEFLKIVNNIFKNKNIYFVYIPEYDSIGKNTNPLKEKVLNLYQNNIQNIKIIDLEEDLDNYSRFNIFPNGLPLHFSINGYDIVSKVINEKINQ